MLETGTAAPPKQAATHPKILPESVAENFDLLWGAEAIAEEIDRSRRATFYMLEKGDIPAAKKVGGRWVVERGKLRDFFLGEEEAE